MESEPPAERPPEQPAESSADAPAGPPPEAQSNAGLIADARAWIGRHGFELWLLTGFWALLVVLMFWLATGHQSPRRFQDEFLFYGVAKAFAAGDGITWRGQAIGLYSWLYPVLLAPAFWFSSSVAGAYTGIHLLDSMMMCAAVFPAFLMARMYMGRLQAFVVALIVVSVPAMNYIGVIGTESLAYTTATAAFGGMLLAAVRPRPRNWVLALGLIAVAMLTRTQFVTMLPIFVGTILLTAAMRAKGQRADYLRSQRGLLYTFAALFAIGILMLMVRGRASFGLYAGAFDGADLTWENTWFWLKSFLADVYIFTVAIPVIATTAMYAYKENRRDPLVGALLALAAVATFVFVAQVTWFSATNVFDWRLRHIFYERYMFYIGPIFFVGLLVSFGRVKWGAALVATAVATLIMSGFQSDAILPPFSYDSFSFSWFGQFAGNDDKVLDNIGMILARFTLALGLVYTLSTLDRSFFRRYGPIAAVALVIGIQVITQMKTWQYARNFSEDALSLRPGPLNFVDRNTDKEVGMIITSTDPPDSYFTTEFWNSRITRLYKTDRVPISSPIMYSPTCEFDWDRTGRILQGGCDTLPNAWFMRSDILVMHLRDEVKRVHPSPKLKSITLMVGEPPPTIFSFVDGYEPNTGLTRGTVKLRSFLERPGKMRIQLGKQAGTQILTINGEKSFSISAGDSRTVTFDLPAREKVTTLQLTTPTGAAVTSKVEKFDLNEGDGWESVL